MYLSKFKKAFFLFYERFFSMGLLMLNIGKKVTFKTIKQ